jgi:hypothetical protein
MTASKELRDVVGGIVGEVAGVTDQDHALKDNSHRKGAQSTLPPHLQGLGIDTNAAQKARDRMAETDKNLSSVPRFEKP